ncbi:hypothetical protein FNF29_02944 [Cafeteria roenbergensis]|uniref:Uncharacterized protein n=1 Tax=Cafeteria roenbergensis TaxID=33653 RepID=A0A5A8CKK6_CAFRO|nr:hypothetical protein FNF29_02944 [Cafeteria roenbergensis]|eukprot:KAA0153555.1 hypothetical protein FNF29_02944 [Cafeteria roenbergensis]
MVPAEWTLWSVIEVGGVLGLIAFLHVWILLGDDGFWSHRLIAECKANARCASELKPGQSWLPGGQVDHGDSQSRSFRQSLPQLVPAAAVMLLVSWGVRWLSGTAWPASSDKREATARSVAALPLSVVQLCWRLVSAVGFAWLVLGSESLLLLAAVTVHWAVVSACLGAQRCVGGARAGGCAGRAMPWLTTAAVWVVACGIKALAETLKRRIGFWVLLAPVADAAAAAGVPAWATDALVRGAHWLEGGRGSLPWYSMYGLVLLRLVSWGMDAQWALAQRQSLVEGGETAAAPSKAADAPGSRTREGADGPLGHAARVAAAHPLAAYGIAPLAGASASASASAAVGASSALSPSGGCLGCARRTAGSWAALVGYTLYPPTLAAGPVTTYNAWLSHAKRPQTTFGAAGLAGTVGRAVGLVLCLEALMQYVPFFSLTKHGAYAGFGPQAVVLLGYTAILSLWLKFAAIWATFRVWALLDGVEVPDNMRRCVANNFSLVDFWKAWHRSYNLWLVRYLYVPLGGSRVGVVRQVANTALVFVFVALWHDVNPELLVWGGLVGLLFVPEFAMRAAVAPGGWLAWVRHRPWYRHAVALVAAFNIFAMVVPNVVGYTRLGERGSVRSMLWQLFVVGGDDPADPGGAPFLVVVFVLLAAGALLMLWVRAGEERRYGAIKEAWRGEFAPPPPTAAQLAATAAVRASAAPEDLKDD